MSTVYLANACPEVNLFYLFYFIFSILKEPNQTGEGKCLTSAPTPQLPLSPKGKKKAEKHL